MSELESCPKCNRKASNHLRRAQGLPTDSEDDDDNFTPAQQPDNDEDDNDSHGHGPAPSSVMSAPIPLTSSMLVPLSLQRTQSTTSLISQASTTRMEDDGRRAKFDERFKTATLTEEEVLRAFPWFPSPSIFLITLKRGKWQHGTPPYTHISACHLPLVTGRESSSTSTPVLRALCILFLLLLLNSFSTATLRSLFPGLVMTRVQATSNATSPTVTPLTLAKHVPWLSMPLVRLTQRLVIV